MSEPDKGTREWLDEPAGPWLRDGARRAATLMVIAVLAIVAIMGAWFFLALQSGAFA